ncbi:MAG: SUMF1/EgtB/PvdO family nonheme iron enzyme [Leptospiraceae bacterium]|nr:SUMF1/EgtB/PvdO family nonheme iron enzyme [Leptospiraceae bacterium]
MKLIFDYKSHIKLHSLLTLAITLQTILSISNCQKIENQPATVMQECAKQYSNMKCIPAGNFIRGSNVHEKDEKPEQTIFISEFYIDTYEVTNEEFNKCIEAGKCKECLKNKTCNYVGPRYGRPYMAPKQPIVGISWYTAKEFCEFLGKRLPTEAEWEKAARGVNGDIYPWGNEAADCSRAVIEENGKKGCGKDKDLPTSDVGTRASGKYGLFDMAGNSWEWVNDYYTQSFEICGVDCSKKDPKGPCQGKEPCPGFKTRVLKGGSWWWDKNYARGSKRRHHDPKNFPEYHHFGFRCAKD